LFYHGEYGLADIRATISATVTDLNPVKARFDSIAVTGLSGVCVGIPVGLALDKPVVIVRKPGDIHHAWGDVENLAYLGKRFLFLDDFMQDGDTARRVVRRLTSLAPGVRARHAGTYLYAKRILRMHSYKLSVRNSLPDYIA